MSEIILYPTETIYGLGVNVLDAEAWQQLCLLKGRMPDQAPSWLVRSLADIEKYAVVTKKAEKIMQKYLPGPLTIVLQAKDTSSAVINKDGTVGFRVSSDKQAEALIKDYMEKNNAPLTCTSANVHGQETAPTVKEILGQFGVKSHFITKVIDGGERIGEASTVVRCLGDTVEVLREGSVKSDDIFNLIQ